MAIISFPIIYFPQTDAGRPVAGGSIYIGKPDLDPEIPANQLPVSIVQEDDTIVPVSQPILTGAGGTPVYNGSPVRIDVSNNFSMKVLDSLGQQVYYVATIAPGGGEGLLDSVQAGDGINVNSIDPANPIVSSDFSIDTPSASYTLTAANSNQWAHATGTGPLTVTCPLETTEDLGNKFIHAFTNVTDADITITGEGDAVVNPPAFGSLIVPVGATVGIKKDPTASDTYTVFGETRAP